jgi:hypothetical protein
MIEQRHAPVKGLSLDECQKWIDEAKTVYGQEAEARKPHV